MTPAPTHAHTAAIVYGFAEGKRHGRRFRAALRERGYTVVRNPKKADVIFAHSGGYLMLPPLSPQQQLVLLDPSYRPDKTPLYCFILHVLYDIRFLLFSSLWGYWAWKTWWNIWYFVSQLPRQIRLLRRYHTRDFAALLVHPRLIVLQSDDRSWFDDRYYRGSDATSAVPIRFIATDHDDCWRQPGIYIELAQNNTGLLPK